MGKPLPNLDGVPLQPCLEYAKAVLTRNLKDPAIRQEDKGRRIGASIWLIIEAFAHIRKGRNITIVARGPEHLPILVSQVQTLALTLNWNLNLSKAKGPHTISFQGSPGTLLVQTPQAFRETHRFAANLVLFDEAFALTALRRALGKPLGEVRKLVWDQAGAQVRGLDDRGRRVISLTTAGALDLAKMLSDIDESDLIPF